MNALPSTQALNPGADLWIVADPESSGWALRIDWLLNFQILRAGRHAPPPMDPELRALVDRTGLGIPGRAPTVRPLLVAADLNLPCRWVLSAADWDWPGLVKCWRELGEPGLRLFLPSGVSIEEVERRWPAAPLGKEIQVVAD